MTLAERSAAWNEAGTEASSTSTEPSSTGTSPKRISTKGSSRSLQEVWDGLPPELQRSLHSASELGRRRRGELREEPLPTMVTALDELLGGGLPRGALVELVGRRSSGRFAMLLSAVQALTDTGEVAALVDLGGHLDPQAAAAAGVELERLLWIRPQRLPDALSAAELLVNTGFPLVAVDLGMPPLRGRACQASWLRLARSSVTHRTAVLVASPYRLSGCAASAVVVAQQRRGVWSGEQAGGREGAAPRLLHGLVSRLATERRRGHRPGERRDTDLRLAETVALPDPRAVTPRHTAIETSATGTSEVPYAEAL